MSHYASAFQVVEVNNTFYQLPAAKTFRSWRENTPDDFRFVLKMSRLVTHLKRLRDPEAAVERFMERASELGDKLGPILLQLPPNLPVDLERLEGVFGAFPRGQRLAVEFRH